MHSLSGNLIKKQSSISEACVTDDNKVTDHEVETQTFTKQRTIGKEFY
jgi:hypothetical protein